MELIDKSALVAEIKRRIEEYQSTGDDYWFPVIENMKDMLSFLESLEVKEVEEEPSDDLEQEIENELERTWCGEYLDTDKFRESAKHFFELGLKARKGE